VRACPENTAREGEPIIFNKSIDWITLHITKSIIGGMQNHIPSYQHQKTGCEEFTPVIDEAPYYVL
jgi:hypothetical protein